MRITILGKSPAWQDAGGACSAYLVEHGDAAILIDCGNGAFGKLREFADYTSIDAVVISHLHADHYFDLIPYSFALTHSPRQQSNPIPPWPGTDSPGRPDLYGPPGSNEAFRSVGALVGFEGLIPGAFQSSEYEPSEPLRIGEITIRFAWVPHFVEAYAMEITCPDGGRIVYGADCRPSEELVEFAQTADLLLIEATVPRPEAGDMRGHLTPAEAGEHATRAGAQQVVLTHISDEIDPDWILAEAVKGYSGPVQIAREGDTFEV